jgi:hypothetical protein
LTLESRPISSDEAMMIQSQTNQQGILLMWSVSHGTSDLGDGYAARPFLVNPAGTSAPHLHLPAGTFALRVHLIADTLDALREQLPSCLVRIDRAAGDDPTIVEVWL